MIDLWWDALTAPGPLGNLVAIGTGTAAVLAALALICAARVIGGRRS